MWDNDFTPTHRGALLLASMFFPAGVAAETAAPASSQEIADTVRSGNLDSVELIEGFHARAEALDRTLYISVTLDGEAIQAHAPEPQAAVRFGDPDLPLVSVPISSEELIVTEGIETRFWKALFVGYSPQRNVPFVVRRPEAGAFAFGKNNANELAYGSNGFNSRYGQSADPYDRQRVARGLSGGVAVAIAAGILPIDGGCLTC